MDLRIAPTVAKAAELAASRIATRLRDAVRRRGGATVAFSGGSTPKAMLSALAELDVPWHAVTVFQVDERVAPSGDPDRNSLLLSVLPVARSQVRLMNVTAIDLRRACREYASRLPRRLDVVHLGIGGDGHTASWPPGDPVIDSADQVAMSAMFNGRVRMTLTPLVINAARWRIVLAGGADKADVVSAWMAGDAVLPISRVLSRDTLVVLDTAAAALVGHN